MSGEILCSESPAVVVAVLSGVLSVRADEVDTDVLAEFLVGRQYSCQFQHDGHAAGTVVGCHHRFVVLGAVGVVVSPRTAVPVALTRMRVAALGL